jgi:hypothetical protein
MPVMAEVSADNGLDAKARSSAWRFVFGVFAVSRLYYLLVGALLVRIVPIDPFQSETSDVPFRTLSLWAHFDGEHYVSVAENGYARPGDASPAFFPLYPLLIRASAELIGGPLSRGTLSAVGVGVSLAAFLVALWFVYRIAEDGWGTRAARGTVLALAFFPTAFFFNSVYTESLFLMLSAGALWAARVHKSLLLACLLAGLAAATRNVGVFLVIPLAIECWQHRGERGWRAPYLALAPSGLLAYMAYLWWHLGDPFLFYAEQAEWERSFAGPLRTLVGAVTQATKSLWALLEPSTYQPFSFGRLVYVLSGINYLYNLLFLVLALALLAIGMRRLLPSGLAAYAFALVLVPALFGTEENPLMGMPRYLIVAFPLFVVLGVLLRDRRLLAGWVAMSATVSLAFCALFVGWYYVA